MGNAGNAASREPGGNGAETGATRYPYRSPMGHGKFFQGAGEVQFNLYRSNSVKRKIPIPWPMVWRYLSNVSPRIPWRPEGGFP